MYLLEVKLLGPGIDAVDLFKLYAVPCVFHTGAVFDCRKPAHFVVKRYCKDT